MLLGSVGSGVELGISVGYSQILGNSAMHLILLGLYVLVAVGVLVNVAVAVGVLVVYRVFVGLGVLVLFLHLDSWLAYCTDEMFSQGGFGGLRLASTEFAVTNNIPSMMMKINNPVLVFIFSPH